MLGDDGAGLDLALALVLPWFLVLSAAFSLGLMEAVVAESGAHLTATRLEHLGPDAWSSSRSCRADFARMRLATDRRAALVDATPWPPWRPGGPTPCCACWRSRRRPAEAAHRRSPTWR